MKNTNTGGPAFPVLHWISGESTGAEEGMTLRDYFAAKAMQGLLNDPSWQGMTTGVVAATAYEVADAMLKAREA